MSIIGSDIAIGWVDDKSGIGELRVCLLREREKEMNSEIIKNLKGLLRHWKDITKSRYSSRLVFN